MYKLVLLPFFVLAIFGCKEKIVEEYVPFDHKLIGDEICGKINISTAEREFKSSFLVKEIPFLGMFDIGKMLRRSGVSAKEAFFSGNPKRKTVRLFLETAYPRDADFALNDIAKKNGFITDSISNCKVYIHEDNKLCITIHDSVLFAVWNGDFSAEIEQFQNHKVLDSNFIKVINANDYSVYTQWKTKQLADLSINTISASFKLGLNLESNIVVDKQRDFPLAFKTPFKSLKNEQSELTLDLSLEENTIADHPKWLAFITKEASKIAFPLDKFLKEWNNEFHFSKGGKDVVQTSEIVSEMDENFNLVEKVAYSTKEVDGFSFSIGFKNADSSLFNPLKEHGIMQEIDKQYQFLISPKLYKFSQPNTAIFSTGNKQPAFTNNENVLFTNSTPFASSELTLVNQSNNNLVFKLTIIPTINSKSTPFLKELIQ